MKPNVQYSGEDRGSEELLLEREIRACPACKARFTADSEGEFCPICMLRLGLTDELSVDEFAGSAKDHDSHDYLKYVFGHYELVKGEDGKPIELGRGAMGVTYKGFDVDLRCPVTLKVISERYLNDQSAQLRF